MPYRTIAVRLRASAEELATTFGDYALICEKVLAYEHPVPNNVHCHLLLVGVNQSDENLKNVFRKHGLTLKGAGQVSFKTSFKQNGAKVPITPESCPKYITYMTKGAYDPVYNKGYTEDELDACRHAWQTYTKESKPTRDKLLLDDFYNYIFDEARIRNVDIQDVYTNVLYIRRIAINFAVARAHDVINVQTRRDASMLYTSVCYKAGSLGSIQINLPFERPPSLQSIIG